MVSKPGSCKTSHRKMLKFNIFGVLWEKVPGCRYGVTASVIICEKMLILTNGIQIGLQRAVLANGARVKLAIEKRWNLIFVAFSEKKRPGCRYGVTASVIICEKFRFKRDFCKLSSSKT